MESEGVNKHCFQAGSPGPPTGCPVCLPHCQLGAEAQATWVFPELNRVKLCQSGVYVAHPMMLQPPTVPWWVEITSYHAKLLAFGRFPLKVASCYLSYIMGK